MLFFSWSRVTTNGGPSTTTTTPPASPFHNHTPRRSFLMVAGYSSRSVVAASTTTPRVAMAAMMGATAAAARTNSSLEMSVYLFSSFVLSSLDNSIRWLLLHPPPLHPPRCFELILIWFHFFSSEDADCNLIRSPFANRWRRSGLYLLPLRWSLHSLHIFLKCVK